MASTIPSTARPRRSVLNRIVAIVAAPAIWLERSRGRWRLVLIALYGILAAVLGMLVWREASVRAIPNVADPFDGIATNAASFDENQNAFHFYAQACATLRRLPMREGDPDGRGSAARALVCWAKVWSDIDPELKKWKDQNAEALRLWRTGAEQNFAADTPIETPEGPQWRGWDELAVWIGFPTLVRIEAARLEAQGEMSDAWAWYRALLRSYRHIGASGPFDRNQTYLVEFRSQKDVRSAIQLWASDPRTDAALIRRALADVDSLDTLTVDELALLRAFYRTTQQHLNAPSPDVRARVREELENRRGSQDWYSHAPGVEWLHEFSFHEPERSRRVARHIFQNWRAYVRLTPSQRADFVSRTATIPGTNWLSLTLFEPADTSAPPGGPPAQSPIVGWYESTLYLRRVLPDIHSYAVTDALRRSNQRRLVDILVGELYRRDHGVDPEDITDEMLKHYRSSAKTPEARPPGS